MAAKKETREVIAPYKCIQSLEMLNERMVAYRQSFESLLDYAKRFPPPEKAKEYHEFVIKHAEKSQSDLMEFYSY